MNSERPRNENVSGNKTEVERYKS